MKTCKSCCVPKDFGEFEPTGGASGRRRSKCNECRKSEKLAAYYRRRDEINRKRKEVYWSDPVAARQAVRRLRVGYKDRIAAYRLSYNRANRDKVRAWNSNYRARKNGKVSDSDIARILNRQRGLCYYCLKGCTDSYHLDHVHPLSRGGKNYPENLVVACSSCNLRKWNKFVAEWKYEASKVSKKDANRRSEV